MKLWEFLDRQKAQAKSAQDAFYSAQADAARKDGIEAKPVVKRNKDRTWFLPLFMFMMLLTWGLSIVPIPQLLLTRVGGGGAGNADHFAYYSPVVVDHTQVGSATCCTAEDVNNYPVQIAITDNRFKTLANGGHVADAQGDDIRPYSDTCTTPITGYEKQYFGATTGQIVINVKRNLSHTVDTTFYLCYDNPTKTADASDASGTYSAAGYISVWHFEDSGGSLNITDALNTNNGSSIVGTVGVTSSTAGKFGAAATPTGGTSYVQFTNQWILANLSGSFVEGWLNTSAAAAGTYLYLEAANAGAQLFYSAFNINVAGYAGDNMTIKASDGLATDVKLNTTINNGAWHLLTVYGRVVNSSTYSLAATIDDANTNTVTWTQNSGVGSNHIFTGTTQPVLMGYGSTSDTIDELRIGGSDTRNGSVSDPRQWIWTVNNNGQTPTTFAALGTEVAN